DYYCSAWDSSLNGLF
nr:immunoglobulin light chain junction region [Macaca mulatta]